MAILEDLREQNIATKELNKHSVTLADMIDLTIRVIERFDVAENWGDVDGRAMTSHFEKQTSDMLASISKTVRGIERFACFVATRNKTEIKNTGHYLSKNFGEWESAYQEADKIVEFMSKAK